MEIRFVQTEYSRISLICIYFKMMSPFPLHLVIIGAYLLWIGQKKEDDIEQEKNQKFWKIFWCIALISPVQRIWNFYSQINWITFIILLFPFFSVFYFMECNAFYNRHQLLFSFEEFIRIYKVLKTIFFFFLIN